MLSLSCPKADVQCCIVHKVRNTISKVRKKHVTELVSDLKPIYNAPNIDYVQEYLTDLCNKWGKFNPKLLGVGGIERCFGCLQ